MFSVLLQDHRPEARVYLSPGHPEVQDSPSRFCNSIPVVEVFFPCFSKRTISIDRIKESLTV